MRILLDHNLDWRLKRLLPGHETATAAEMGWEKAPDGDLLPVAEAEFDVILTGDQNFPRQQNLRGHNIALIVLVARRNILQTMAPLMPQVLALLPLVQPGRIYFVPPQDETESER